MTADISDTRGVLLRGKSWTLRRHVPLKYRRIEARKEIWITLSSRTEAKATQEARRIWKKQQRIWDDLLIGAIGDPNLGYRASKARAEQLGYTFLSVENVSRLPINEICDRVEAVRSASAPGEVNLAMAAALLGGAKPPNPMISFALDVSLTSTLSKRHEKSPEQERRWRSPRIGAVKTFINLFGDMPVEQIDHDMLLNFRASLVERILNDEIKPESANQILRQFILVMTEAGRYLGFRHTLVFADVRLSTRPGMRRPPFSESWIKTRLLAADAFAGLDIESRCILLGMINTGYRLSEGANLTAENIHLDAPVPHITISGGVRHLKTSYSKRHIPLVGVSLDAFKTCPGGFPTWADRPRLSARLNDFLRLHGLNESNAHTVTSLRHSFSDRLLDANVDLRLRCDLMGHKFPGQNYGRGGSLETLHLVLRTVAL